MHDWVARLPVALSAIALCLLTALFGAWAFGRRAGFYAGLCMATCVGLFLVHAHSDSRRDADVHHRAGDVGVPARIWMTTSRIRGCGRSSWPPAWASGLLLKSLIGVVFPVAAAFIYLVLTRQLFRSKNLEAAASVQWTRWSCC